MSERAVLREVARLLRGPHDRLADGRELVVVALPAGGADLAAGALREAALTPPLFRPPRKP